MLRKLQCPHCGARLEPPSAPQITCPYCKTTSRVQGQAGAAAGEGSTQIPLAKLKLPKWLPLLLVPPVLCVPAGIVVFVLFVSQNPTELSGDAMRWSGGGQPILHDVTGDGTDDIVGWVATGPLDEPEHRLAAFDGSSGRELWTTGPLQFDNVHTFVTAAADRVVLVDARGVARGFDIGEGKPVWKATLGERADAACASGEDALIVTTTDEERHRIALADGSFSPASDEEGDCEPTWSGKRPRSSVPVAMGFHSRQADVDPGDMDVDAALAEPGGERLALVGRKEPGTAVPTAGAYRCGTLELGEREDYVCTDAEPLWTSEVPAKDPLGAEPEPPQASLLWEGTLYAAYGVKEGAPRVTAFDLETGRRRWDIRAFPAPEHGSPDDIDALYPLASRVVVAHGCCRLEVLEASSGETAFSIGQ